MSVPFQPYTINSNTGQEFVVNTVETDLDAMGLKQTDLTIAF